MKVIIVEDEKLAAERLLTLLKEYDASVEVIACLESIEETVAFLSQHTHPDLLLLDIHLSDGHSFEIFKHIKYNKAVVFTTAYDQYALDAFQLFSVDYIVKPITLKALATALNKYTHLAETFSYPDLSQLSPSVSTQHYKKRFLGKIGQRLFFLEEGNITYFQADNKVVSVVDKENNRYIVDYTLEQLEQLLDPREFFRLNRRFIIHINSIDQVKPFFNHRLKLMLKGCHQQDDLVISRDRVADFKEWANS